MSSIENTKELRKIEINKVLKNPLVGFFEMSRLTEEEAQYHLDNICEGNVLVYVENTYNRIWLYEIKKINLQEITGYNVDFEHKMIVEKGSFVEQPKIHLSTNTISRSFLMQFVAVLRKDPRKFQIQKEAWGSGYNLTVNGHYEATPTGKIKHFGSKDLAMNFIKSLTSGSAKHTDLPAVVKFQATQHQAQPFNLTLSEEYKHEVDQAVQPLVDRLRAIRFTPETVYGYMPNDGTIRNLRSTVDTP